MKWEQIEANWDAFKNIIKYDWDKLSDDHLDMVAGRRDYLVRKIQAVYGLSKADVEAQLSEWQDNQINIDGHFYQSKPFSSDHTIR
ncbi:MAG: general stress protein CsbD [Pseudomonadota bacterium]